MSLTNPNTVVTEERLNDFYKGILPYLGGMPEMVANKFSKGDLYSTDEKMIGQWVDGKPLYQRSYVLDSELTVYSNAWASTGIDASNVEVFIACKTINAEGALFEGTMVTKINNVASLQSSRNDKSTPPSSITVKYVVLQYTKTTDSPISIGSDTDYSTEEKIVGTWVDGRPIWQKTVECGALPNNTTKSVAHGISNLDFIVELCGSAKRPSDNTYIKLPDSPGQDLYVQGANIVVGTNSNKSGYTSTYVTLQYIKTTD